MAIPKRLSKAMDSLTVNHEWGGVNEMPERSLLLMIGDFKKL